jgi:hypothetical protein
MGKCVNEEVQEQGIGLQPHRVIRCTEHTLSHRVDVERSSSRTLVLTKGQRTQQQNANK